MEQYFKELYLTDELHKARAAKARGEYVALCLPLVSSDSGNAQMTDQDMQDFPYCIEQMEDVDASYLDKVRNRLMGKPCEILRTSDVILREITCEDVPFLYDIYDDDAVRANMEPLYPELADEISYTQDYIRCQYGFHDFGMWIMEDIHTHQVIGRAGLDFLTQENLEKERGNGLLLFSLKEATYGQAEYPIELGFVMGKDHRGKGLTGQICQRILAYVQEEMPYASVYARVRSENRVSIMLLKKLGFFEIMY